MPSSRICSELIEKLIQLATVVPQNYLLAIADELERFDLTNIQLYSLQQLLPQADWRQAATEAIAHWKAIGQPKSGTELAIVLRTCWQWQALPRPQSNELLWSGPLSEQARLRRSDQAILDLLSQAQSEAIACSFSLTARPEWVQEFQKAIQRGVRCRFIVETSQDCQGYLNYSDAQKLKQKIPSLELLTWPLEVRQMGIPKYLPLLHAKFLLVDSTHLLVSSANFSEAAMERNLEVGIISHDPIVGNQLRQQIRELELQQILQPWEFNEAPHR